MPEIFNQRFLLEKNRYKISEELIGELSEEVKEQEIIFGITEPPQISY